MFFCNLMFFCFLIIIDFFEVDILLLYVVFKFVGVLEMNFRGFILLFGCEEKELFFYCIVEYLWLIVGGEDKILLVVVVNDLFECKLEEIEEKEGWCLGGCECKCMKDDLLYELLLCVFVKFLCNDVFIDLQYGYVVVDIFSCKIGEYFMFGIRGLFGSFLVMLLNVEVVLCLILIGWIVGELLLIGLSLGEECEMKDLVEGGVVVKCQYQELCCDEIDKYLDVGKQVIKLVLIFEDNLFFVIGDDLIVCKLKFFDGVLDQLEYVDEDGCCVEFDVCFVLQSVEICCLFLLLEEVFKFSKVD